MFSKWLRDNGCIPTACRLINTAKAFGRLGTGIPNAVWQHFRRHFAEVWLNQRAISYCADRDPKAVPYLSGCLHCQTIATSLAILRINRMGKARSITIATRTFAKAGDATLFFREMLNRYKVGDRVSDADGLDLAALVERHDEKAEKIEAG
jgi:hypothetical protein